MKEIWRRHNISMFVWKTRSCSRKEIYEYRISNDNGHLRIEFERVQGSKSRYLVQINFEYGDPAPAWADGTEVWDLPGCSRNHLNNWNKSGGASDLTSEQHIVHSGIANMMKTNDLTDSAEKEMVDDQRLIAILKTRDGEVQNTPTVLLNRVLRLVLYLLSVLRAIFKLFSRSFNLLYRELEYLENQRFQIPWPISLDMPRLSQWNW
jgi:hypothetical protein